jgi:Fe-S oxidoreductase
MLPQTSVGEKDPKDIITKIVEYLREGRYTDEVFEKVFTCTSCGKCSDSCSLGIDVLPVFEAVKMKLAGEGKIPEAAKQVMGIYDMWKMLSAIQTKASETRWLTRVPEVPEPVRNVVFIGCTLPAFPHIALPMLDILDRMKVDYVALAGGEVCCGFPLGPSAGMAELAEKKIRKLVDSVRAFSPQRVILPCPGCYRLFTEIYPKLDFIRMDFEVVYFTDFLREHLRAEDFVRPLNKKIVLHESCMSRRTRMNRSTVELLRSIPGLTIVDGGEICCGGTPMITHPEVARQMAPHFIETLSAKTIETQSDCLSNICQLCSMTFYPCQDNLPFDLIDTTTLVSLSLGGKEYENQWPGFWRCKNIDELIGLTREAFEENGVSETEAKAFLSHFFRFSPES